MTPEQALVDCFVNECVDKVLPLDILDGLSDTELYYIRNGIYAYAGCTFASGYYDCFDWYDGTTELKDFSFSNLNAYQYKNIMNILYIENSRRIS